MYQKKIVSNSRIKNQLTKDKIYTIVKLNCEVTGQENLWKLTDQAINKYKIHQMKFGEFFRGDPPSFETTYGRGQFSKTNVMNRSLNTSNNKLSPKSSNSKLKQNSSTNQANKKVRQVKYQMSKIKLVQMIQVIQKVQI